MPASPHSPPIRAMEATETTAFHAPSHYEHLSNAMPQWLGDASLSRRVALKNIRTLPSDTLKNARAAHHIELKSLIAKHMAAQNEVDRRLAHLQDAEAFAAPLLKQAIEQRFGLDLDVRATYLRLYIPVKPTLLPFPTGSRTWTVSLLAAALHNFERDEVEDGAYETDSTFISQPSLSGQFEPLPLVAASMTIKGFASLCRELDIGARYKTYLEANLGIANPVTAAALRPKVLASQQTALRAALQLGRMNGDLSEDFLRMINGTLDGIQGIRADGQHVLCHDLAMMSTTLTGIIIFAADPMRANAPVRVVAYVPDDPEHPIKEYASAIDMLKELTRQLRSSDYQRFFSRFVAHEQRGQFFSGLNRRLGVITWHQTEAPSQLPAWRDTPINSPNLQFSVAPITADLWQHLYIEKLNKILNDGQAIAVATAIVDRNARWAAWDSFVHTVTSIFETALFVVAPFVPGLGELMMAYMAWQLLDATFEGIIDWAQGRALEAFGHFMDALESLIQAGIFAAGSSIGAGEFRQLLPAEVVAFIDRLTVIKTPGGETRYWEPNLTPYQRKIPLPKHSRPDPTGLHVHDGTPVLPLEGAHYAVDKDPRTGRHRIQHPTRADAYQPLLYTNDQGAWHTELERPLTWDRATVLMRLGPSFEPLGLARRADLLEVSGCPEDALRKMHVDEEPLPPLLADSAKRFIIDQDLQTFIEQISSDRPDQFLRADPMTQLQLLARENRLPESTRWNWVNDQGDIAWTSSPQTNLPLRQLEQATLKDGDVLKTLLINLSEPQIKTLLGEPPDGAIINLNVRAGNLRKITAQAARKHRATLFEERYKNADTSDEPLINRLIELEPNLPTSMAGAVVDNATGNELLQLDKGVMPERIKTLTAIGRQEVRLTRAYEGLELASVSNPDTDRLALHSLARLDGWSDQVRLDIREASYAQPPLDSTGQADAPVHKTLVRVTDNTFQAYDEQGQALSGTTDFYSSVLQALPDTERDALNIHIGEGETLRQAVRKRPLARDEFRTVLTGAPQTEPSIETTRLLGTSGYTRRVGEVAMTLNERISEVYPNLGADELQRMAEELRAHPQGARMELARRAIEIAQLRTDLRAWVNETPRFHPVTGQRLTPDQFSAARQNRRMFKKALKRCWFRDEGSDAGLSFIISEPILGDLPVLAADFSHVKTLSLEGNSGSGAIDPFLERFTDLRRLDLRDFPLDALPPVIARQTMLEALILSDCGIRLSIETREALGSLTRLKTLDLYNNPLGFNLDFQRMPDLEYADLGSTGITEPPQGWLTREHLNTIIMSNNQITDLPAHVFQLSEVMQDAIDVAGNPLSDLCLERIKTLFANSGRDFGVLAPADDIRRVRLLYPTNDIEEASNFVYRLAGTLEQGRMEITRLEAEYAQLSNDLSVWTAAVPQVHPLTGAALDPAEAFIQQDLRDDFKAQLEACWRRETELDDFNENFEPMHEFYFAASMFGELPTITADFSHVSVLYLESRHGLTTLGNFLHAFPKLQGLTIRRYALGGIPAEVFNMGELKSLALPENHIQLDDASATALAGMDHLDILDLTDNPLGRSPDVSQMHALSTLSLSHTHISEVPNGLFTLTQIDDANLSHNSITELPPDYFELPPSITESYNFQNNPLSEASLQLLISYFQRTGADFGVDAVSQRAELEPGESTDSAHED
ncbi:hypothetical protein GIW70_08670 [Pseudomonas syringae]|nr:hypothetical protein [Pseudomonas syringae]MCF5068268.1 hypothetical protein [Pseudomonas syringae]